MEALAAVFKELYTSFLLRDFAGKIVPGCFLLVSYSALFLQPREIIKGITGKVSHFFGRRVGLDGRIGPPEFGRARWNLAVLPLRRRRRNGHSVKRHRTVFANCMP